METSVESCRWRDYYFVLFEGALFYYKDSKSTTPTGFITLRYAAVEIQPARLARGEYVFNVVTPCRTVVCKTKHPVALSEWISALEQTAAQQAQKHQTQTQMNKQQQTKEQQQANDKKNSLAVLQNINKLIADVSSFNVNIPTNQHKTQPQANT